MDGIERLKQLEQQKQAKADADSKFQQSLDSNLQLQQTIVRSFQTLVSYLDNRVSKTAVVNQLKEINTPDALKVVEAVESLHKTVKTHENTDLSEITGVMKDVLAEAQKIPKDHPEIDIPHTDYSGQFKSLEKAIQTVQKAIESQELNVEAPIVNVPQPQVIQEATNFGPMKQWLGDIEKAVRGIVIPETKLDTSEIEKILKRQDKRLKELVDKPIGGGGGSGGRATPYETNGTPAFIELIQNAVPTASQAFSTRITTDSGDANVTYIGKAAVGSLTSAAVWQIQQVDETSGTVITWADGDSDFNNVWDNRESLTYS